ncbi:hypothetical protein AXG93_1615s1220 [Marchantia polymorpha subsp. ruderalis]|uniref:Uncharacterized protein n=1 Tax=Marchantia polymorpha subsp. ruderalis TaxID=1480154 RepID=A0A176VUJ3_MARPO|nr:hypothetical protein AXG93_1615s1220 [Marchantia polymorpha subsp. ruderalis]
MEGSVMFPLLLSMMGGLSTGLGGLLVVLQPKPSLKMLGTLQGLAAGMMLSLSFLDLMHNATNAIGFTKANLWFFGGVIAIALIVTVIPEPTLSASDKASFKEKKNWTHDISEYPQDDKAGDKPLLKRQRKQVWLSGIVTAVGISLHNFPEGMAIFLGSVKGVRIGVGLAIAIGLHNIPEGVAVALPVYFATESKWEGFKLAFLSGLAEPLGVVLVAYLFPSSLSPDILEGLLGAVGGVMAFITLREMLPLALEYAGHRQAVTAVFVGMAIMSLSLELLAANLPQEMTL